MVEIDDGVDEDYLVPCEANEGPRLGNTGNGSPAGGLGCATLAATHGAMVASGILTAYAGVFAEHIHNRWPALANALSDFKAAAVGGENRLHADLCP